MERLKILGILLSILVFLAFLAIMLVYGAVVNQPVMVVFMLALLAGVAYMALPTLKLLKHHLFPAKGA